MRRQRAAGLAGGTENRQRSCDEAESGEKVAQLLGRSRSGQDQKNCSQNGESWPEKPRFAFKLRRATFTTQAVRSCQACTSNPGTGGDSKLLGGGGWSRGYRPIGVSPRH